ncbi:hypothetical protein ACJ73_03520 [Blastomyces percursus]|uniref:Uncharacterized protein n=1 Tax=Blastomyces percursus TaxID=1658174 RepID=A0A1J9R9B6_9EURO|nr:hypothetical protein ACJ73_03520 [Blastomyces percursus]
MSKIKTRSCLVDTWIARELVYESGEECQSIYNIPLFGDDASNSLFNTALKQSSALRRDLEAFAEAPTTTSPAVQGQISASLTSFSRTIDDYSSLSKQELIPAKQELAFERLKNFRTELADYRQLFDRLRKEREDVVRTTL